MKKNDVFLHFTGNIFGIGCALHDQEAIQRIKTLKQRDDKKGFILLFSSLDALKTLLPNDRLLHHQRVRSLLNQYLPGNVTVVIPCTDDYFQNIISDGKIAFRIPSSRLLRDYIQSIDTPILSTSINVSSQPPCSHLPTLHRDFSDWFDWGLYDEKEPVGEPTPSTIIDVSEDFQIKCLREGSIPFAEILSSWECPQVTFVCAGNICRSPMAESYVQSLFTRMSLSYRASSCGVNATVSSTISDFSRDILHANDLLVTDRPAMPINDEIVQSSTLLLCMSKNVKDRTIERYPNATQKIFTFAEYIGEDADVDDPYTMSFSHYEKAWGVIKAYSDKLIEKLTS
jgi:tRNA threonylcarbamoyl adenosine modification protein (Sua5/YciO/YrdC/YwlC family)